MREEYWEAISSCDERYDGRFVYAVTTTGVFCRPSCKSKTPSRQNVTVFSSPYEALSGGFRPCKRCRPDQGLFTSAKDDLAREVTRLIDECFPEDLTLRVMAGRLFVSPFHLQRVFKESTRMSPARYLRQRRIEAARCLLTGSDLSITAVALSVGFKSPAHFSSVFRKECGRGPADYRSAARETIRQSKL